MGEAQDGRTQELAREAGDKAAKAAKTFLDKHNDLIDDATASRVIDRERVSAIYGFERARNQGRINDNRSLGLGLKVIFTSEGFEAARGVCEQEGYPLDDSTVEELESGNVSVSLPTGVYTMGWGGCQFHQEASLVDKGYFEDMSKPFAVGYQGVLRIEGDSGELWQNWDYTPEDQPLE